VAEHHEVVAERCELRRGIGGVGDGEPERTRLLAGSHPEVLATDVGVVQAQDLHLQAVERDRAPGVPQVGPAVRFELSHKVGSSASLGSAVPAALAEVSKVVVRPGDEIVVRSQDEERSPGPSEAPQGLDGGLDCLGLAHEVARHHAEVARGQPGQESAHRRRSPCEMEIGEVQHGEGRNFGGR
jgi:hypothetical protein